MFFSSSTTRMLAILSSRQLDGEAAAFAHFAVEMNASAVCLDDIADDRKPEACRTDVAAGPELREPFEDALALLGWNAGPGVAHGDLHRLRLRGSTDADTSRGWRITQRVREQVGECPGQFGGIAHDRQVLCGQRGLDDDLFVSRLWGE